MYYRMIFIFLHSILINILFLLHITVSPLHLLNQCETVIVSVGTNAIKLTSMSSFICIFTKVLWISCGITSKVPKATPAKVWPNTQLRIRRFKSLSPRTTVMNRCSSNGMSFTQYLMQCSLVQLVPHAELASKNWTN